VYITVVVVLARRAQIQTGGRGIITTSNSRSRAGRTWFSAGDDADHDELYRRYIAPSRPELNATDSRSSDDDVDLAYGRQPLKISGVPRVSQLRRNCHKNHCPYSDSGDSVSIGECSPYIWLL